MLDILGYEFMRRAFIVGGILAIILPLIGLPIILKRLSMMGDSLSHASLAGVSIGLFLGINPILSSIVVCSVAGLSIEYIREKLKSYEEISTVIILAVSIGLAGIFTSFAVSPIRKIEIVFSYIIAAWLMSLVITLVVLLVWTIVMYILGYKIITVSTIPLLLVYITLNSLSATSFTFFIVNFVKSMTAFSSISTILGTLTGFLAGIYLPIGALPHYVQNVMKLFPPTYGVAQIRSLLTREPLDLITKGDSSSTIEQLKLDMGINVKIFKHILENYEIIYLLLFVIVIFTLLSVYYLKEKKNEGQK